MFAFYDERISVLNDEIEKLNQQFNPNAPRESDLEQIKNLEEKLTVESKYLKTLLQEFMSLKSLIVSKESEYNKRFGAAPKIGVVKVSKSKDSIRH